MTQNLKAGLEKLKATLEAALIPKNYPGGDYVHPTWQPRLDLINSLFLIKDFDQLYPVPKAWIDSLEMPDPGDHLEGRISWDDVYNHLLSKGGKESFSPSYGGQMALDAWREERGQTYRVWHCWMDYGATGEGRTLHYRAFQAYDEIGVLHRIMTEVDAYYAQGYDWSLDFPDNSVTQYLVSPALRQHVTSTNPGSMNCALEMHFNYS